MKNNARRLLSFLIAVVMALGLTACGNKEPADPNLVEIGDYTVLYKGACIMADDEGNDAVVLTLDYTNNSKEDCAFWVAVFEKAMQDGVQLDTALVYPDPDSFVSITDDKFTGVAPGKTSRCIRLSSCAMRQARSRSNSLICLTRRAAR